MIDKDGTSLTLTPLQDEGIEKQIGSSVIFVGKKELMKTMKEEGGLGYAIVIKPKSIMIETKGDEIPNEVQALLNKY